MNKWLSRFYLPVQLTRIILTNVAQLAVPMGRCCRMNFVFFLQNEYSILNLIYVWGLPHAANHKTLLINHYSQYKHSI